MPPTIADIDAAVPVAGVPNRALTNQLLRDLLSATSASAMPPRNFIFDTDWFVDVDDVAALRVADWAHKKRLINLIGVVNSTQYTTTPQAQDSLMAFDGVPAVPIASGPRTSSGGSGADVFYNSALAGIGTRRLYTNTGLQDSLTVMRTLLANLQGTTEIITIGFMSCLSDLLQSPADDISPLTGMQLYTAKVTKLWVMGGQYPSGSEFNFIWSAPVRAAASYVCANCPGPIVFVGSEIGDSLVVGSNLTSIAGAGDPVSAAFTASNKANGRSAFDPVTMFIAIAGSPEAAGFTSVPCSVSVDASTGANTTGASNGRHSYVVPAMSYQAIAMAMDNLLIPAFQPATYMPPVEPVFKGPFISGVTDSVNLYSWWNANDLTQANGVAVPMWPDRRGRNVLSQSTVAAQPLMATAKNGKKALSFTGATALSTPRTEMPEICTIYVNVQLDTSPTGYGTMIINAESTALARSVQFNFKSGGGVEANSVREGTFSQASIAAPPLAQWNTLSYRRLDKGISLALGANTVQSGTTALVGKNRSFAPITVGSTKPDGSNEALVGWIHEIRIYVGAHTTAQISAVAAEMVNS